MILEKTRDTYADSLKFFLIICVIIGHTFDLGGVNDRLSNSLQYAIYTYHMPLFVFMTGYFTNCQSKNFKKGILNLGIAYVLFQVLHIVEDRRMPITRDICYPAFSLWYILSCIWWRLLLYLLEKKSFIKKQWLPVSVLLSILIGFVPNTDIFSIQRTFAFLPFFMLGHLFRGSSIQFRYPQKKVYAWLTLIMIFLFIYFLNENFFPFLTGRFWYSKMPVPFEVGILSRVLWYVIAIVMSIAVMSIVPNSKIMAKEGCKTLQYYLLHTLIIPICWGICNKFGIEHDFGMSLLIAIFSLVLISFVKDMKIVSRLVKPIQ